MLKVLLAFVVMIICYVVVGILAFKRVIRNRGEKLVEEAKEEGREVIGNRIKFYRRHEKTENRNDETYKAKYEYYVDGKRYTTNKITKDYPDTSITIYYKENHKAIKENSMGVLMIIATFFPLIMFVFTMWIQVKLGL